MNYKKLNNSIGWLTFLIATIVYFMTLESTVSLWDCGEYITAANKLEVGHPPGAPLFMLLGRLFSFFASDDMVAVWINRMSGLSSSFTILFTFWSITMLAKKMAFRNGRTLSQGQIIAIMGSGFVGAMAYTFTDSFWFSAVEGEVYAMSSLFTAMIFWAILKWDEEMNLIKEGDLDGSHSPMRWMVLIMFLFGLAIGVHLLGLLVVPSIAYVIYFNRWEQVNIKGFFLTGVISVFALGFIQEGIIPGTISWASKFEIFFVNSLGLPFYVGGIFFFILLIVLCIFLVRWSRKKNKPLWNVIGLGLIVLLIGYGSFATIVIRSNANPPLDENDPENLVTLYSYLKREQYGSWPIVYGPYWNSEMDEGSTWGDRGPVHARRFVVQQGDIDIKAFKDEARAKAFVKESGRPYEIKEKYFITNEDFRKNQEPTYLQNTIFPRMFWNSDDTKVNGYKDWSGYSVNTDPRDSDVMGSDGQRLPRFSENITYFMRYQMNWMYWRYFMWNFAGRQNDIQGHGDQMRGNWLSGVKFIDEMRLGAQGVDSPTFTQNNPANNKFFFLPLILGIIGMCFHFYRAPKDAFVVFLTFIFTGLAIVIYLNQKPFEPRERDYAYAASFYAFAMWIGLGVYALYEAFKGFTQKEFKGMGIIAGSGAVLFLLIDLATEDSFPCFSSWLYICLIAGLLIGGMTMLGKTVRSEKTGAILAAAFGVIIPVVLGAQGWDDHNRHNKTSARDLAYNYLEPCTTNSILFTNGDNDTFPLWYLQEVEKKRTDVRVCNLSLMGTDWYTDQMKMRAYLSDPLPIKFEEDQIMMYAGGTDQVFFLSMFEMMNVGIPRDVMKDLYTQKINYNKTSFLAAYSGLMSNLNGITSKITAKDANAEAKVSQIKTYFSHPKENPSFEDLEEMINKVIEVFNMYSNRMIEVNVKELQDVQGLLTKWEKTWDYLPIEKAMEFTRDDKNMFVPSGRRSKMRFFPSHGFVMKVNKDNVIKSGIAKEEQRAAIADEVKFFIDKQYLTREQVMMMDILANNDWKRGIYFSSPYGSNVSIALLQAGFVKQVGLSFELNPVVDNERIPMNMEKMYNDLMNVYSYGKMNQPGVLTDYYTRRHTSQLRSNFSKLAEMYLNKAESETRFKESNASKIELIRAGGNVKLADSVANVIKGTDARVADYKSRAVKLIKKSLDVMPVKRVIDYGEPNRDGNQLRANDGSVYPGYSDGDLHNYVVILYRAGAKEEAEKLGMELAKEIETILNYFEKSSAKIGYINRPDLTSALTNYMIINMVASDESMGNPDGKLARHMTATIQRLYSKVFPAKYKELDELSAKSGESRRTGYGLMRTELQGLVEAIGIRFGYIASSTGPESGTSGGLTPEQIQQMMEEQGM